MNILERYHAMDYGPAPEARNEADAWLAARDFSKALFIGGEWKAAAAGKTFDTSDPPPASCWQRSRTPARPISTPRLRRRPRRCRNGARSSGYDRAKVLYAIGRAMQRHQRLFAVLESLDNGKPIRESRDIDVPLAIRHFIHHAGWAQALDREFPDQKPVGVVGQIIPWNFPLLMLAWKIAPALAAGCTVVLKPAEFTPLTAILFAEICERAGVPKGVVNIVPGGPEAGAAIVNHPGVQKIAFTGSSEVGKIIRKATAGSGKKTIAGARRQVGLHRLRGRRSRQRGRGTGRRHLVQPGPGLLRRLAAAGAGRHRRGLHRQGQDADGPAARRQPARQEHRYRPAGRPDPARPRARVWSPKAPSRAPTAGSRTARCRPPAISICRRSPPASRRPTSWRRKRCSGRCWRP